MTRRRADGISLVFPVAGNDGGENFRGFERAGGESLIHRSLRAFLPFADQIEKIHYIVLEDHAARFDIEAGMAGETGRPFELIRLSSPTRGPAESVARGIARHGITGPLIVCDIDHRLDAAPLFDAIAAAPQADALVSLWPLAGEQLRRWSVACLGEDDTVAEVAERRLPGGAGRFFGVIGCYYFPDAQKVMDCCLEKGFARFSDYFNHLATLGRPARGVRLQAAEFFGDAERIRQLEETSGKPRGTIFCDIDGTLVVHEDRPDYSRLPQLLPGAREKLRNWIAQGFCVVLCTARAKQDEARLAAMLRELDIPYHQLVTGLPSGVRILINDRKPHAMFTPQAASLEIARDQGIAALEILPARDPTVLRRFKGGSFAETLLIEENGKQFVRKRAARDRHAGMAFEGLRNQFHTMGRFARMAPGLVPALYGEEDNSHEYFYDMEYLDGYRELAVVEGVARAAALDRVFDRFAAHIYCQKNGDRSTAEDWFRRHLAVKIHAKVKTLVEHDALRPLLRGEGLEINGVACPSLTQILARAMRPDVLPVILPQFLSLVHGDLTFQNIMTRDGDTKVIDMEAPDSLEAVELDLGKLYQSTHSRYESWWQADKTLCDVPAPGRITLNFMPAAPERELGDALNRRWSTILGCSRDAVEIKGRFYLGLHLVRMVPFRMRTSMDHALYALATALTWLNGAVEAAAAEKPVSRRGARRARAAA